MLIHYLKVAPFDAYLWIVLTLVQLLAVLAVHYSRMHRTHRAITLFIYFCLIGGMALMAIPVHPRGRAGSGEGCELYTWTCTSMLTVQWMLTALCVADLYRRTLGPKISLPARVPRDLRIRLAIAFLFCAAIGLVFWPKYGTFGYRALMAVNAAMTGVLALALWILVIYGARIAHFMRGRVAQIAIGFVLMLSVNPVSLLATVAGAGHISWPAQRAGQFFDLLAFVWWCWKFSQRAPVRVRAKRETVAEVIRLNRQNVAGLAAFQAGIDAKAVFNGQSEVSRR